MLCLQFFEGRGYNDEFAENMMKIKNRLENENPIVNIVSGTDMLCEKCPHRRGKVCINEELVQEYDKSVYNYVATDVGDVVSWSEITEAVNNNIINADIMCSICSECRWAYICLKYNKRRQSLH